MNSDLHASRTWLRGAVALLIASLALGVTGTPALAQRCFTQNGQTICCDNSGNCYSR